MFCRGDGGRKGLSLWKLTCDPPASPVVGKAWIRIDGRGWLMDCSWNSIGLLWTVVDSSWRGIDLHWRARRADGKIDCLIMYLPPWFLSLSKDDKLREHCYRLPWCVFKGIFALQSSRFAAQSNKWGTGKSASRVQSVYGDSGGAWFPEYRNMGCYLLPKSAPFQIHIAYQATHLLQLTASAWPPIVHRNAHLIRRGLGGFCHNDEQNAIIR